MHWNTRLILDVRVASLETEDTDEIIGINTPDDLKLVEQLLKNRCLPSN